MSDVSDKIEELKKLTKTYKNTELAKVLGISPSTIQTWKKRDKIPEDIFMKAQEISENGSVMPRGYLELKYFDVEVSAGHGALIEKAEESQAIIFSEKFIRQDLGYNPNNIFLMPVRGDSMTPTLKSQSLVMVNRVDGFTTDGIYVFRYDGRLMVKRLQFLPNGIKVVSDNNAYEPWELSKSDVKSADFEIIGEVIWSGQRM